MSDKFAHICGRIRALESKRFNKEAAERMIGAKTAEEAFQVLNETDFADGIKEGYKAQDFESVINDSIHETKSFLVNTSPENGIVNIIWARYDYYNIKTVLKAKLKEVPFEKISGTLTRFGNIDFKEIKDSIYENKLFNISRFNDLKRKVFEDYEKNKNLQRVDIICDKQMGDYFLWKSEKLGSELILDFFKKRIDLFNTVAYLRTFEEGFSEEFFIKGGNLDLKIFLKGNKDEINKMLKIKIEGLEKIDDIFSQDGFLDIQFLIEKQLSKLTEKTKLLAYGKEVIFAYFWNRVRSAITIRLIMVGKINGVPQEKLRNLIETV